jgi:hypothetical protein
MTNYEADEAALWRQRARDEAESYHPHPSEYMDAEEEREAIEHQDYLDSLTKGCQS